MKFTAFYNGSKVIECGINFDDLLLLLWVDRSSVSKTYKWDPMPFKDLRII